MVSFGEPELEAVNLVPANIFVSLDSLIVSMGIVFLATPTPGAFRLGGAFLLCDGLATFAGLSAHSVFAPVLLFACFVLLLALRARSPSRIVFWAPALFSLDNLFAGITAKPSQDIWLDSLTTALASGLLALAGVAIATAIRSSLPKRWMHCTGLVLLTVAIFL